MPLVDSHCHLQDEKFDADRADVMARSLDALDWLVIIGDDLPTSRAGVALVSDRIYAAVGVHPYYAATVDDACIDDLRTLAANERVVAIGEIGLDYFKYNDTPRDVQAVGFRRQLDLAVELNLPVVIHNREAFDDTASILEEYAPQLSGGVMHCFAGSTDFAEQVLSWGFYISFAGNVTFPKAEDLRTAARVVPMDRLLVETDAPYLAPQAVRGKRCEPGYVRHTAEYLAEFYGVSYEDLSQRTAENAADLFNISS
ncbi:MAG: hydrolase TatD [Candidatus Hydrogenedentota bacterium]|nr:MAG: hydrolase TatD [Candidatus Hydrogenedentota bacterium]